MKYTFIIPLVTIIAIIADIVFRIVNQKNVNQSLGKCILPLTRRIKKTNFILIALIFIFTTLLFFRKFELWMECIFALIAIMAVDIVIQDYFLHQLGGIYENAIITLGKKLLKENVNSFPTFEYENDSESDSTVPPNMIKTVTEQTGIVYLEFVSPEERNEAAKVLKNWL
mgnify:FL=1|jgi:Ca2+/Na+ antiporter